MAWLSVRPYTFHRDWNDIEKTEGKFTSTNYGAAEEEIPYDLTHRVEWAPPVANGALGNPLDPYQEYTMVKNMGTDPVLLYHNTNANWPNPPFSRVILPGCFIEVVDLDTITQPRIWVDSALYSSPMECEVLQIGYQAWEPEEPDEFCDAWAVGHYLQDGCMTKHYPELGIWANVANPISDAEHWLADVAGVAEDDYWAVGYSRSGDPLAPSDGIFAFWNGAAWSECDVQDDPPMYGDWGFTTAEYYAVGGAPFPGGTGEVWLWNGTFWAETWFYADEFDTTLYCVHGDNNTNIFVAGANELIGWYNGAAWAVDWLNYEGFTWYGTATVSAARSWVCGGTAPWLGFPGGVGTIYRRLAPGIWSPALDPINMINPPTLRAMWAFGADEAWAVGDSGTLLHWTGGPNWEPTADPYEGAFDYRGVFGCWPWGVWAIGMDEATGNNVIIFWDGMMWVPVHGPNLAEGELLGLKGVRVTP